MDSQRDVDFRLRLADGFLGEARDDVTRARWRSCVDNAQLAVENAVKAVIARFVPVPRTHDLVTPLDGLLASGRLTPGERDALVELRQCAAELGHDQHIRSDYGEEAAFKTPWELFDAADARRAMTIAERSVTWPGRCLGAPGGEGTMRRAAVSVAGRPEGHRLARGAGAGQAALPDAAVEPDPVSKVGTALLTAILVSASAIGLVAIVEAQPPIRIGATYSKTGSLVAPGQNQRRGAELCVKHASETGGVLGRRIELLVEDDQSNGRSAAALYEKLITRDKVDAIFGPYSSPVTAGMADVTERHRMSLVAAAAATSIFKQGRKYAFMLPSSAERYLEGLVDIAASRGLKTVAVFYEETLLQKTIAQGALELAKKRGLEVLLAEAYPSGTTDFGGIVRRVKTASPDVLAVATYDTVAITRLLKDLDVNPKMFGATVDVALPEFYQAVGRDGEFVYGASLWEPELVTLRAGGLIPIARQYPGAREFVEAHRQEYPGAEISYHTGIGYGGCQVLLEAIRRAGSLDREKVRDAVLKLDFNTVFGRFKVDKNGLQIGHKMVLFQWQDGKKVIVWPEELAPGKPRFPTPPWSERR